MTARPKAAPLGIPEPADAVGKLIGASYQLRAGLARRLHWGTPPVNPQARRLREDGVLVLPELLLPEVLAQAHAANRGLFERSRASELLLSPDGIKIIEAADVSAEEFARYYFLHSKNYPDRMDIYRAIDPHVRDILTSFYGSNYFYRDFVCYRSQPTARAYQGSYAWHRDNYPVGCLKVMTYLTDVLSESEGPFIYAPGTHIGYRPQLGRYGPRIPREQVEGRLAVRACLGPAGTIIIFDNNGIHRASNPARGHREALNATVFPRIGRGRPPVRGLDMGMETGLLKKYAR